MNKKLKIFIIFSICIFIIFIAINFKVEKLIFPGKNKHEDSQNKTHVDLTLSNKVEIKNLTKFYIDIIEKYYRNKDLFETNNIKEYFSDDMNKLIDFKNKVTHYVLKNTDWGYYDYKIKVIPWKQEEWSANKLMFTVIRSWRYYPDSDFISSTSEGIDIQIRDTVKGPVISEIYSETPDLLIGPVDELYKSKLENKEDKDAFLQEYYKNFKKIFKKNFKELQI